MRIFYTTTHHTVYIMGLDNDCTFLDVEDVKAKFIQLLWCYRRDLFWAWLYIVKIDQSKPHSIEPALVLDDDGVLKVLSLFKIA